MEEWRVVVDGTDLIGRQLCRELSSHTQYCSRPDVYCLLPTLLDSFSALDIA